MYITKREQKALEYFNQVMNNSTKGSLEYDTALHIRAFLCKRIRQRLPLKGGEREAMELVLNEAQNLAPDTEEELLEEKIDYDAWLDAVELADRPRLTVKY